MGIDNDSKAVIDAQSHLAKTPTVQILLADVIAMPFPDNSFDVVILMMTLVNFNDYKVRALKEMARVLKQNGKIIISVYSENAFAERIRMYEISNSPIKRTEGTKVFFDIPEPANESEQFSKEDIKELASQADLKLSDCKEVKDIAYICELMKK